MAELDEVPLVSGVPGGTGEVPTLAPIRDRLDDLIAASVGAQHDASASAINPVLVGGYASDSEPTAVSTAVDAVRAWFLLKGVQVVAQISSTLATGQVAPTASAATLVAARVARRRLVLINHHASVDVYVGPATVTTANGVKIAAGGTLTLHTAALVQGITASGTGSIHYVEEY